MLSHACFTYTIYKSGLECIKALNNSQRKKLLEIHLYYDFLAMTPKLQETKQKSNQAKLQLTKSCTPKGIISKKKH